MTLEDPVLTVDEAAAAIRAEKRTMDRWRTTGEGPDFIKIGRRVGYRRSALEAWLKRQTRRHTDGRRAA